SLAGHAVALTISVILAALSLAPCLFKLAGYDLGLDSVTLHWLNGVGIGIAGVWSLPIALSSGLGWLTRKLAPRNPVRDTTLLDRLEQRIQIGHPNATVHRTEEPDRGWPAS